MRFRINWSWVLAGLAISLLVTLLIRALFGTWLGFGLVLFLPFAISSRGRA